MLLISLIVQASDEWKMRSRKNVFLFANITPISVIHKQSFHPLSRFTTIFVISFYHSFTGV